MKYLARMIVNYEIAVKRRLNDSYAWHQLGWKLFPGKDKEKRNFLSRLDQSSRGFVFYLLSDSMPIRPDWCLKENWGVKEISNNFLEYDIYRFDLRANPTKKIKKLKNGVFTKNGKRIAILKPEEQIEWLKRKAKQFGFELLNNSVTVNPAQTYRFRRKGVAGLHIGVRFQGVLKVIDRSKFREAFNKGIGSAKAFLFGMLLLKPLK